jgi:hypothetical protein
MIIKVVNNSIGVIPLSVNSKHYLVIGETMLPDTLNPLLFLRTHLFERLLFYLFQLLSLNFLQLFFKFSLLFLQLDLLHLSFFYLIQHNVRLIHLHNLFIYVIFLFSLLLNSNH